MEFEVLHRLSHLSLIMLSSWVGMPIRYLALNQAYRSVWQTQMFPFVQLIGEQAKIDECKGPIPKHDSYPAVKGCYSTFFTGVRCVRSNVNNDTSIIGVALNCFDASGGLSSKLAVFAPGTILEALRAIITQYHSCDDIIIEKHREGNVLVCDADYPTMAGEDPLCALEDISRTRAIIERICSALTDIILREGWYFCPVSKLTEQEVCDLNDCFR